MSFANPWMLIGLLATAVPIWLHLRRQPLSPVPFPAFPLLLRVAKKRAPRVRLRRIVLLVLRILLLLAVVLAAAKPSVDVIRPGGIRKGAPLAMVIVLDNSLSMKLRDDDGKALFLRAKEMAEAELDRLRPGDAAALLTTASGAGGNQTVLDFDLVQARTQLEGAHATFARGDLSGALNQALSLLEESPLIQREVLLISDLADNGDPGKIPPWSEKSGIGFRVMDAGPEVPRENSAVERVAAGPSEDGASQEVVVEARIANHSNKNLVGLDVILEVDGAEVARGTVDVEAEKSVDKRFYHRFKQEGLFRGSVRIPEDRLPEDNVRHFSHFVSHSISALVIDGDYRPGSYHDEAFYLNRALETPMPKEVPIVSTVIDIETAANEPLTGHDVVFLVGVPELPLGLADRLISYAQEGGGLFISPGKQGSNLTPLDTVLPAPVRSIRQSPRKNRPYSVGAVNRAHPVFEPFGEDPTGLESTEVFAHLLVEPETSGDQAVLIDTNDGLPLLLERPVDEGTTMLLTTTIDRDWTDLPIRPGFLPLVQRCVRHLADRLDHRAQRLVEVGAAVPLEVSAGMRRLTVRGPEGPDTVYTAQELAEKSRVSFTSTDIPGDYLVWAEIPGVGGLRELTSLGFIVATNPRESNPQRQLERSDDTGAGQFAPVLGKLPVWPYLLMAAFLLLMAEAVVAGMGLRRSHRKRH